MRHDVDRSAKIEDRKYVSETKVTNNQGAMPVWIRFRGISKHKSRMGETELKTALNNSDFEMYVPLRELQYTDAACRISMADTMSRNG